jgi:porphobilinogen synthase
VSSKKDDDRPIAAMPGVRLLSGKPLIDFAKKVRDHGVPAVLLFAVVDPAQRDLACSAACSRDGPVQKAMSEIKSAVPELGLIADLCLCEYRSDGHCWVLRESVIDNDETLEKLAEISVVFAASGADVIAPSGMMDGAVFTIRRALDEHGYHNTMTMPYSAKFHSALYGPFKAGTDSNPGVSMHHTHQMAVANGREAMREIELDLEEGADMIIVKPALTSLDIIHEAKDRFQVPTAAYFVDPE